MDEYTKEREVKKETNLRWECKETRKGYIICVEEGLERLPRMRLEDFFAQ